jgi:hypothetical protein
VDVLYVSQRKMKKIGTTSTGAVIVEMTAQEYNALQQLQIGIPSPVGAIPPTKEVAPKMTPSERLTYVAERLMKLSPKKKDGVIHSIEAMFQFSGGISTGEVEKIIVGLQKQKFFTITPEGRVAYNKG